jgi:hypothetical protein
MSIRLNKIIAIWVLFFVWSFSVLALANEKCAKLFYSTLADHRQIRIMSYNFLNLENYKGKHIFEEPFKYKQLEGQKYEARARENKFRDQQAQIIQEINPDFIIAEEVDGLSSMKNFSRALLDKEFDSLLISGNDPRGIDIGLFFRIGLEVNIEHFSHKDLIWFDPITKCSINLFSRDLPIWIVRDKRSGEVLLILAGMHSKSKRDRDRDKESFFWRSAQIKEAVKIIKNLSEEFSDVPLVWGGDFNTDFNAREMKPAHTYFEDAFDVAEVSVPKSNRVTHSYFPYQGKAEYQQLDGFFVLNANVLNAQIFRYRDENGKIKAIPKNIEERKLNPSDHFPIYLDLAQKKK